MKQKIYPPKFRKLCRDNIYAYRDVLGLNQFQGDIKYMDSDIESESKDVVLASCSTDNRYLTVTFSIYPCLVERWKDKRYSNEKVKEVLAHEVAHIATQQLFYMATCPYKNEGEVKDAWEGLTEIVGRLIYRTEKAEK